MIVRWYNFDDIVELVDMTREALKDSQYRDVRFDMDLMEDLFFNGMDDKRFFCRVIDHDQELLGLLVAHITRFVFSRELMCNELLFYVKPEYRGTKGLTALVGAYVEWGKSHGARRITLSSSMGNKIEKFAALATKLGFEQVGTNHQMRL